MLNLADITFVVRKEVPEGQATDGFAPCKSTELGYAQANGYRKCTPDEVVRAKAAYTTAVEDAKKAAPEPIVPAAAPEKKAKKARGGD